MSKIHESDITDNKSQVGETTSFRGLFARNSHCFVTVPIIQRDFAQGRDDESEIRDSFLDSVVEALLKDQTLDLDFVYGSIEGEDTKSFCPLDGQQRLTTLFLLHWYLAWTNGRLADFRSFISVRTKSKFTYAVRPSSGEFFDELVRWDPVVPHDEVTSLRRLIEDQNWFYRWWKRDPTIQSCLTMLESMHARIETPAGLYDRLVDTRNPRVTFQLLDLNNFGLTDDLYIKMNARGKPLTSFEVFKARLETRIEKLLPGAHRSLEGEKVTTRQYFSQKIDREWAEFFWKCRAKKSRLFDNEVMNLVGAVALVTRDPGEDSFDETIDALRDQSRPSSYHLFSSLGCLDVSHINSIIDLLDFVATPGGYKSYLPKSSYFDEEKVFRGILSEGRKTSYPLLIQFFAYFKFLQRHGAECDADRFFDWMRVIVNLTKNSNIERPEQFKSSLSSIAKLLDQSGDILEFIAGDSTHISPFSRQQIREERIKARLITKHSLWSKAVLEGESHPYFDGQIEFLLDFAGILAFWNEKPELSWSDDTDKSYFSTFECYREKASQLFEGSKLKDWGDFRIERALLTFGDYLLRKGQNSSFLEDADSPISWKRLLRGEQLESPGRKRVFFKLLLDSIDLEKGVRESLDEVIATNKANKKWRQLLVDDPRLISYCFKRKVRFLDDNNVYLLRRERRSTDHADLFSYSLFLAEIRPRVEVGALAPFASAVYNFAKSDTYEPSFTLSATKPHFSLMVWNFIATYCLRLSSKSSTIVSECKECLSMVHGFTEDNDGDFRIDASAILEAITRIAETLNKHR